MKQTALFILVVMSLLSSVSCSSQGKQGDTGAAGPSGPQTPGLYFIRQFQQGVYSANYSGQTQACLWEGQGGTAYYDDQSEPVEIGMKNHGYPYRPLIRFDIRALPTSKIIVDKAELTLTTNNVSSSGGAKNVQLYKVTTAWVTNQAGWDKNTNSNYWAAALGGGDFSSNTITPQANSFDLNASSTITIELDPAVVQSWMTNPGTNYGVILIAKDETIDNYAQICPSKDTTAANRPMLKIFYYTTE